ncbi:uncharacterized protein BJ212DRAFT_1232236, partial [Suillus subaureus]
AHAMRWAEEVELLHEEMRCVLRFFEWQANWWVEQGHWHTEMDIECLEGICTYATKQAGI